MGFQTNEQAAANNGNNNGGIPEHKKAQGFINIYLPTIEGGKRKVGALPLLDSDPRQKKIREILEVEGEAAIERFRAKIIIEYNSATPTEGSAFDL